MDIEEDLFLEAYNKGIDLFGLIEFSKWLYESNAVLGEELPVDVPSAKVLELLHSIEHGHFN